jgi:acetyltransferase-like isoleucine patch superfamily enzyme
MNWNSPARFVAGPFIGVRIKRDPRAILNLSPTLHIGRNVYIHAQDGATIEIEGDGYIDEGTRIVARGDSSITIGPGIWTHPGAAIYAAGTGRLLAGERLFLGRASEINCTYQIMLHGRNAFAAVCHVIDSDHSTDRGNAIGQTQHYGRIEFGMDTLCSAHVVVTRGVTIGDGAVVGANAVVTRDIPPYEIWAGVPAAKLRERT